MNSERRTVVNSGRFVLLLTVAAVAALLLLWTLTTSRGAVEAQGIGVSPTLTPTETHVLVPM